MKIFIFAIGGTGARVLRSFSYCLASGMYDISKDVEFVPMIIDYDTQNGDKTRAREALEKYVRIHNSAYPTDRISINSEYRNFFLPKVSYLSEVAKDRGLNDINIGQTFEFTFNGTNSSAKGTFADFLGVGNLTDNKHNTKELLSALYNDANITDTDDYPYTELNLDMEQGFKGNPNIGTVVFDKISSSPEYKTFERVFDPQNDRIFIIGSIFGGTGSSGIPQLIKSIRNNATTGWRTALIGTAFVMPYFKVGDTKGAKVIDSNIFKSKQKAALLYYRKKAASFNISASYYIGDNDSLQTTLDYNDGLDAQRNNAHFVELATALGILDFAKRSSDQLNSISLEYGIKGDSSENNPFKFDRFEALSLHNFLKPMAMFALAVKYYKDYLLTSKRDANLDYYDKLGVNKWRTNEYYKNFESLSDEFCKWLSELSIQTHPFKPFKLDENNLDSVVDGYKDGSGIFSDNANYKGFDARCNKLMKKSDVGQNVDINKSHEQLFLKMMYEASNVIFNKLERK